MSDASVENKGAFAARLRKLVGESGRSARQIALEAGVDPAMMSRYMSGDRYPKIQPMRSLAHVLGVSEADLTCDPDEEAMAQLERDLLRALRIGGAQGAIGFLQRHAA
jgi:transcriptional regulator with XRE-family HTH domain